MLQVMSAELIADLSQALLTRTLHTAGAACGVGDGAKTLVFVVVSALAARECGVWQATRMRGWTELSHPRVC